MPQASKVAAQALLQQTLGDVIRKLRGMTSSADEDEAIAAMIEDTKAEVSSPLPSVKVAAIQKAMYFCMLGYNPSYAAFPIVETMADRSFANKRIAYMAAGLCFTEYTDVIPLTTSLVVRDLQSPNAYEQALALHYLAAVCTPELAKDVISYVVDLLDTRHPAHLRKKAVVCLYKLFLEYPDALRPVYAKLKEKVDDSSPGKDDDSGVRGAVVCVLCELARRLPKTYLGLAIPFYSLLSSIEGNWALIKIVKVFGYFVPHEPRLVKKLTGPLERLIESTKATSVKYECYRTIMSTTLSDVPSLAALAVEGVGSFLEDTDQNLRFMALEASCRMAASNPKALQPLRRAISRCLEDVDTVIRVKAARVLRDITPVKHLVATAMRLVAHSVVTPPDHAWTNEVVRCVMEMVRRDDYASLTDYEWYVSVLLDLYQLPTGTFLHGAQMREELIAMLLRVSDVRPFAVGVLAGLILDGVPPAPPSPLSRRGERCTRWHVLSAAVFACGEYPMELPVAQRRRLCVALSSDQLQHYPADLQCAALWAVAKLVASVRQAAPWGAVAVFEALAVFLHSPHPCVAETAAVVRRLVESDPSGSLGRCVFGAELLPVAASAQEACRAPPGVDLEAPLCPDLLQLLPLSESDHSSEDEDEDEDEGRQEDIAIPGLYTERHRSGGAEGPSQDVAAYYLDGELDTYETARRRRGKASGSGAVQGGAAPATPAPLTAQLMKNRQRAPQRKAVLKPVLGPTCPAGEAAAAAEEEEEDEVTRRLRGVDVRAALTAQDALPNTGVSYETLLQLAAQQKEEAAARICQPAPLVIDAAPWLELRLRHAGCKRRSAGIQLRYSADITYRGGSGAISDVRLLAASEGVRVLVAASEGAEGKEGRDEDGGVLLTSRLQASSMTSVDITLQFSGVPAAETAVQLIVSCLHHRQAQRLDAQVTIPFTHWVVPRPAPRLSSEALHALVAQLPAASIAEEVLTAIVPCHANDLLIAVPQLQTDLGFQAVEIFPTAAALYAEVVAAEAPKRSKEKLRRDTVVLLLLREATSEVGEYAVEVAVRSASPPLAQLAIAAVIDILQGGDDAQFPGRNNQTNKYNNKQYSLEQGGGHGIPTPFLGTCDRITIFTEVVMHVLRAGCKCRGPHVSQINTGMKLLSTNSPLSLSFSFSLFFLLLLNEHDSTERRCTCCTSLTFFRVPRSRRLVNYPVPPSHSIYTDLLIIDIYCDSTIYILPHYTSLKLFLIHIRRLPFHILYFIFTTNYPTFVLAFCVRYYHPIQEVSTLFHVALTCAFFFLVVVFFGLFVGFFYDYYSLWYDTHLNNLFSSTLSIYSYSLPPYIYTVVCTRTAERGLESTLLNQIVGLTLLQYRAVHCSTVSNTAGPTKKKTKERKKKFEIEKGKLRCSLEPQKKYLFLYPPPCQTPTPSSSTSLVTNMNIVRHSERRTPGGTLLSLHRPSHICSCSRDTNETAEERHAGDGGDGGGFQRSSPSSSPSPLPSPSPAIRPDSGTSRAISVTAHGSSAFHPVLTSTTAARGGRGGRARLRRFHVSVANAIDLRGLRGATASATGSPQPSRAEQREPPSRILDFLYLGAVEDAKDAEFLASAHVSTILNISTEEYWCPAADVLVRPFPIDDRGSADIAALFMETRAIVDRVRATFFEVERRRLAGDTSGPPPPRVLVHCHKGRSRSAAIVAAYLMYRNGWTVDQSLQFMRRQRPSVDPNIGFLNALRVFQDEMMPYEQRKRRAGRLSAVVRHIAADGVSEDDVAAFFGRHVGIVREVAVHRRGAATGADGSDHSDSTEHGEGELTSGGQSATSLPDGTAAPVRSRKPFVAPLRTLCIVYFSCAEHVAMAEALAATKPEVLRAALGCGKDIKIPQNSSKKKKKKRPQRKGKGGSAAAPAAWHRGDRPHPHKMASECVGVCGPELLALTPPAAVDTEALPSGSIMLRTHHTEFPA
eukprot:gene11407-7912_t